MVPDLIVLALDYFRAPLRFSHLADPGRPLPDGFDNLVSAFGGALAPRNIESIARALGTGAEEVERASRFFLRQVLLSPRSNHYRVLGLSPNASDEAIRQHYQLLVRIFHPDRSVDDPERDVAYTARINEAYNVLKNLETRQAYDRQLASTQDASMANTDTREPFLSSVPVGPPTFRADTHARFPVRRRSLTVPLVWGGVAIALVASLVILLRSGGQPLLRANPKLADESIAKPSFLKAPPPRPTGYSGFQGAQPLPSDATASSPGATPLPAENATAASTPAASSAQLEEAGVLPREKIRQDARRQLEVRSTPNWEEPTIAGGQWASAKLRQETRSALEGLGGRDLPMTDVNAQMASLAQLPPEPIPLPYFSPEGTIEIRPSREGRPASARAEERTGGIAAPGTKPIGPEGYASAPSGRSTQFEATDSARNKPAEVQLADEVAKRIASATPNPEPANVSASGRRAERVAQKERATAAARKKNAIPVSDARREGKAQAARPKQAVKTPTRPKARPEDLIARLVHYYSAGNLNGFVGLFTSNARVNDGSGKGFIRADYARFFAKAPVRRLSISNLSWRSAKQGKMIGRGAYRVRTKESRSAQWRNASGELRIELVPMGAGFKISKMIYR